MKPSVSFLFGSGFSIPEGLPGVGAINIRLSKIDESEIHIHTDQQAFFLNGQENLNGWSRWDERLFVQQFLEFYNTEILKVDEVFHYETFYDFYSGYLYNKENGNIIENFCSRFNGKIGGALGNRDCLNRISDFNRTFNQLLASLLSRGKYFGDGSGSNYPWYGSFLNFLHETLKSYDIKVHTLNHDLFFDWLASTQSYLSEHYCDGFEAKGSPFYGLINHRFNKDTQHEIYKAYHIKLEHFVDSYNKALCLYKLHGSINNIIVHKKDGGIHRIKHNYLVEKYYHEDYDAVSKEFKWEFLFDETAPDFLSGTTNKTRYYTNDPHYINLLNHFKNNLEASNLLFVIGYGYNVPLNKDS